MRRPSGMWGVLAGAAAVLGAAAGAAAAIEITVDASKTHQTIEGFGTCLISWSREFQDLYRTEKFQRLYLDEVGCNMLRINLWGPVSKAPVEDAEKIRWQDFDLTVNGGRAQIFIDFGQALRRLNPAVQFIGTVWSPPAWMKENASITDKRSGAIRAGGYGAVTNRVKPQYYPHFAKWLVEMVKLHKAQGVPLLAVSPGNEVQFTQSFESCVWDGKDFATIVRLVGERLEREGLADVRLFGPETMTGHLYAGGTGDYVRALMADPEVAKHLDIFATHGYEDGFKAEMSENSSRRFWDLVKGYGKPYWMTEGGTGGHDWPEPLRQGVAAALHNALVAGNASAFVPWQITEKGPTTHGLMVMDRLTPKTHAAMHFFRFIRPGAVRLDAEPAYGDVMASAFRHPATRALAVVLINLGAEERPVRLVLRPKAEAAKLQTWRTSRQEGFQRLDDTPVAGGGADLVMPPESIVTLYAPGTGAAVPIPGAAKPTAPRAPYPVPERPR